MRNFDVIGELVVRVLQIRMGLEIPHWKVEENSPIVLLINAPIGASLVIILDILEMLELLIRENSLVRIILAFSIFSPPFCGVLDL